MPAQATRIHRNGHLSPSELSTRAAQDRFLACYEVAGNISSAATAAGVHRDTVYDWLERDSDMPIRLQRAHASYADSLERRALERVDNPVGTRGTDTLLITMLNAHRPELYKRFDAPQDSEALALVRELRARLQPQALPRPTVEGQVTDVTPAPAHAHEDAEAP